MSTQERRALLDRVQQRALEWDDAEEPVFFDVIASGSEVDAYGTYMLTTTLRNFAADADAGVSVLDSHRHDQLGFGQSVTGHYVNDLTRERTESTFFTIPGLVMNGKSTDSYIKGMKRGLWRDISVGFWMPPDARIVCTVCGGDMLRWYGDNACPHFPGQSYETDGRAAVAYGGIDGARLSEYSLVYDGATPGAGVANARAMEDAGELDPRTAGQLEQAYQVHLQRATGRTFSGWPPARLSMADAIEQSAKQTERAHQRFLRTVKTLHEVRRLEATIYVGHAGHVNVGSQQVNIVPAPDDPHTS
jgi:hypothetical protein